MAGLAVCDIYLGRQPVFDEALTLAATGYVPTKSAYTGLAIKR